MIKKYLQSFFAWFGGLFGTSHPAQANAIDTDALGVLKKGMAQRVVFFYPGEEGTYVDNAEVTLFENGIVHIKTGFEEATTSIGSCEILWRFEGGLSHGERASNVRLLRPGEPPQASTPDPSPDAPLS